MNKATEARLTELKREKEEIEAVKTAYRNELGPTDSELLDALEEIVLDEGHVLLWEANGNAKTGMRGITDNENEQGAWGDGIREFIADLIKNRQ